MKHGGIVPYDVLTTANLTTAAAPSLGRMLESAQYILAHVTSGAGGGDGTALLQAHLATFCAHVALAGESAGGHNSTAALVAAAAGLCGGELEMPSVAAEAGYRRRFVPFSALSAACVLLNVLSLAVVARPLAGGACSTHHTLLANLATADALVAALLWVYHNAPVLLPPTQRCAAVTAVLVVPFVLAMSAAAIALLLLALSQYLAIVRPLAWAVRGRHSGTGVRAAVGAGWALAATLAALPVVVMVGRGDCREAARALAMRAMMACAALLVGLVLVTVILYVRIYRVIVNYRREAASSARPRRANIPYSGAISGNSAASASNNYKAFLTTLILAGTLALCWLPYLVLHFLDDAPDAVLLAKFYFVDFLPVINAALDPIIYGVRVAAVRRAYRRLAATVLPCCMHRPVLLNTRGGGASAGGAVTVRFTTADAESTVV